jgi:hypothetical protein
MSSLNYQFQDNVTLKDKHFDGWCCNLVKNVTKTKFPTLYPELPKKYRAKSSVGDLDPWDPYVFRPPESGSITARYRY